LGFQQPHDLFCGTPVLKLIEALSGLLDSTRAFITNKCMGLRIMFGQSRHLGGNK
jgi:hypothetical protein